MRLLKKIEAITLDLLFPQQCVGCGKEGVLLCPECAKSIPLRSIQVCPLCEKSVALGGTVCSSCANQDYPLDQLLVAADYDNPLLARLIHLYKYRFITDLHEPLGQLLLKMILMHRLPIPDVIIPLPLHPHRLRWRGFNQAELLARYLSQHLTPGLPIPVMNDLVVRKKNTRPQMSIKKSAERLKNIQGAFELSHRYSEAVIRSILRSKKILLVDDVCTTGETLKECASLLRNCKPSSVSALVLGRQHYLP